MKLEILIPTYNRAEFLLKNLYLLVEILHSNNLKDRISISISDNFSTDNTNLLVAEFIKNQLDVNIHYYKQKENIGFEANILFLLKHATGKYVMFLGDDDYLDERYVLKALRNIDNVWCILPSFKAINVEGNFIEGGRDYDIPDSLKGTGFCNLLANSHKAHQISGIIVKREGLYDKYIKFKVHNLYPQVFFVSYCCLKGKTLQITSYPVLVTQTSKKDWGYGKDGLVQDFYDNYKKIGVNPFQRVLLEIQLLRKQPFRYYMYSKSLKAYLNVIKRISFGDNTSFLGHMILPIYLCVITLCNKLVSSVVERCKVKK